MSGDDVPEEYRPRLCHVLKWDDFPGYGFNLHAEKGKAGQFIGKVDAGSPAEAAGLKEGDRIVEVNGVNIGNENHQQVVNRIRTGGEETRLFVVDSATDNWFKDQKMVVKGDLPCVLFGTAKRDSDPQEELPEPVVETTPEPEREPTPEPEPEPEPEPVVEEVAPVPFANGNGLNDDDEHRPRLCHIRLWPHFQGYGFNLHAERDKPGQYIGLVDDNSPSSTAGLRVHDRIVEVNGANVEKESHSEVISRIKAVQGETRLLVVDPDVDAHYREKGVTVSSSMPQTLFLMTPDDDPMAATDGVAEVDGTYEMVSSVTTEKEEEKEKEEEEEEKEKEEEEEEEKEIEREDEQQEEKEEEEEEAPTPQEPEVVVVAYDLPPEPEPEPEPEVAVTEFSNGDTLEELDASDPYTVICEPGPVEPESPEPEFTVAERKESEPEPEPEPEAVPASAPAPAPAPAADNNGEGLELNLSVSEMKERLKSRKRQDPRHSKVSFEQKYRQFQRM